MDNKITVITLGVKDLDKAVSFYRDGLGLRTDGIIGQEFEYGAVAFFNMQNGLKLGLWPQESIRHDTGLKQKEFNAPQMTLGHNVNSKAKVDSVFESAVKAGATAVKEPSDTFYGGYAAYFQDLDGHVWEIVWNPNSSF